MTQAAATDPNSDYSWAEYLHCMEGGSDVLTLPQNKPARVVATKKQQPIPGLIVASVITFAAIYLSQLPVWPFTMSGGRHPIEPVMLAIALGMALSNAWALPRMLTDGIKFSVKKLLPIGIVFLGARLNFYTVVEVGLAAVLLTLIETALALALLVYLARKFNLPRKLGLLLGVGTAICGGTAIVATAPVIDAEEKDVVFSVATVTLLGLLAMFTMPLLGSLLEMSQKAFGVWAGLAIHQTPQVVAAGFAYGDVAGDTATIVKLARVCLLAPVVFLVGYIHARNQWKNYGSSEKKNINYLHLFPMFVFGFLGMALLRTLGFIPDVTFHMKDAAILGTAAHNVSLASVFDGVSKFCIIISMAGVGLETRLASMKQTGLKPFLASFIAILIVATLMLVLIKAIEARGGLM